MNTVSIDLQERLAEAKERLDKLAKTKEKAETTRRELRASLATAEENAKEERELALLDDRPENSRTIGAPEAIAKRLSEAEARAFAAAGAVLRQSETVVRAEDEIRGRAKEFLLAKVLPIAERLFDLHNQAAEAADEIVLACREVGIGVTPLEIFPARNLECAMLHNALMTAALRMLNYERGNFTDYKKGKKYSLPVSVSA